MKPSENPTQSFTDLPTDRNRITKLEKQVEILTADISALRARLNKGDDE